MISVSDICPLFLMTTDLNREERVKGHWPSHADDACTQFSNTCCSEKHGRLSSLILLVTSEYSAGVITNEHLEISCMLSSSFFTEALFPSFLPSFLSSSLPFSLSLSLPSFPPFFLSSLFSLSLFLSFLFRTYLDLLICQCLKKFRKITTTVTTQEHFRLSHDWLWNILLFLKLEKSIFCLIFSKVLFLKGLKMKGKSSQREWRWKGLFLYVLNSLILLFKMRISPSLQWKEHAFFSPSFFSLDLRHRVVTFYFFIYFHIFGKHCCSEPSTNQEGLDSLVNHRACLDRV